MYNVSIESIGKQQAFGKSAFYTAEYTFTSGKFSSHGRTRKSNIRLPFIKYRY